MAGYAATVRIDRFEIRTGPAARGPVRQVTADAAESSDGSARVVELAGAGLGEEVRQRLAGIRTELGQLTWYLVNPEGWR